MNSKQLVVIGKTEVVITLNKVGVPIRGRNPTIITIDTPEKEGEINGLVRMGLIQIIDGLEKKEEIKEEIIKEEVAQSIEAISTIKRKGRPKGSKNGDKSIRIKTVSERIEEAEAKTQQMGSRVVIGTGNGNKEGKMTHSAIDDMPENSKTKDSMDAMRLIEAEENLAKIKESEKIKIAEENEKLDPSEQIGRKATISDEGKNHSVKMVNNAVPGSETIKNANPFINDSADDDFDDAFIKLT